MRAKLLEVNTETSICECCGKTNLKRVAVIQLADGRTVRYGTTCAAKKLGSRFKKEIEMAPNTPLCGEVQPGGRWVMRNTNKKSFVAKEWDSHDEQKAAAADFLAQTTFKRNSWQTASFTEVLTYIMSTVKGGQRVFVYRTPNGKRIDDTTLDKLVTEGLLNRDIHQGITRYTKAF